MIVLLQRVTHANVVIEHKIIGAIDQGILAFIAIEPLDTEKEALRLSERILHYRIFEDQQGKMNLNIQEINGGLLIIPQFTLAADTKKGMRPSFTTAATPILGEKLFNYFVAKTQEKYHKIATGKFGANMQVNLCNDGPVTFILKAMNNEQLLCNILLQFFDSVETTLYLFP